MNRENGRLMRSSGRWHIKDKDAIRGAYHRGAHWAERVEMAQWWANYLDQLRTGGMVIPLEQLEGKR